MSANRGNDIITMLSSHDKRIKEASGILSRLMRLTWLELAVTPYKWNLLLINYLDKLAEEHSMSQDRVTNERNNLRKGLSDPDMTFEMLTRGMQVLNPKEMFFKVELKYDNEVTVVSKVDMLSEEPDGIGKLTRVYRELCGAMGKDVNNLEPEIDAYLSNSLVREEVKGRKKGNDKGNLRREIPGDSMTWDVFKKGLRVLAPVETLVTVQLRWNRNRVTNHCLRIITPKLA
jgi:hypothetical protein